MKLKSSEISKKNSEFIIRIRQKNSNYLSLKWEIFFCKFYNRFCSIREREQ